MKVKKPKKESVVKKRRAYWYKLSQLKTAIRLEAVKLMSSNFYMAHDETNSAYAYTLGTTLSELTSLILDNSKLDCNECPSRLQCHLKSSGTTQRLSLDIPLYAIHSKKIYNHYDNCMYQQIHATYGSSYSRYSNQLYFKNYNKTIDDLEREYKEYFVSEEETKKHCFASREYYKGWILTIK